MAHAGVISLSGWSRPLSVRGRGLVAWLFLLIAILGSGYQLARAASHVAPAVTADHAATTGSADAYDLGPQHARARVSSDRRTLADVGQKPLGSAPTSLAASTVVAAEAGSGARFVVGAGGETTMSLRAGTESLEVTEHAALRMTQRGISIDAAESTLGQPSFQYFHQGVWKTGYYDPSSRIFIGTVDGRLTTVINNASPNYIANLQAATP